MTESSTETVTVLTSDLRDHVQGAEGDDADQAEAWRAMAGAEGDRE